MKRLLHLDRQAASAVFALTAAAAVLGLASCAEGGKWKPTARASVALAEPAGPRTAEHREGGKAAEQERPREAAVPAAVRAAHRVQRAAAAASVASVEALVKREAAASVEALVRRAAAASGEALEQPAAAGRAEARIATAALATTCPKASWILRAPRSGIREFSATNSCTFRSAATAFR